MPEGGFEGGLESCRRPLTFGLQLLGSAYALGADSDQLTRTYEHEITQLVPIARGFIRGEAISKENWRDFLTRKECVVMPLQGGTSYSLSSQVHNGIPGLLR